MGQVSSVAELCGAGVQCGLIPTYKTVGSTRQHAGRGSQGLARVALRTAWILWCQSLGERSMGRFRLQMEEGGGQPPVGLQGSQGGDGAGPGSGRVGCGVHCLKKFPMDGCVGAARSVPHTLRHWCQGTVPVHTLVCVCLLHAILSRCAQ